MKSGRRGGLSIVVTAHTQHQIPNPVRAGVSSIVYQIGPLRQVTASTPMRRTPLKKNLNMEFRGRDAE